MLLWISSTRLSLSMVGFPKTVLLSLRSLVAVRNPGMHAFRFALFPFRSPLLWKSIFLSLPPPTSMFQFSGFPLYNVDGVETTVYGEHVTDKELGQ